MNWKTTLAGLATAMVNLVLLFACDILQIICLTPEQQTVLITSVTTIGLFAVSLLAKDKDVTGGSKAQTLEAKRRV